MGLEQRVYGYLVSYEEDAKDGVEYLWNNCDAEEAGVFFKYAHAYGPACFRDEYGRKFILTFSGGAYTVTKR